ncbi:hypothetical protein [Pedobacter rhodius]|uniref:PD-(D/E)XK nuclease superfamily protein n=1 Tax=Pedobacter rhodius TaxID=3004098 RepID=A0ABT4KXD4_9SPHI|nr:hypothetical protein [Pedobacter sp. SJ11]MCZ4222902.1 hypothetical protein [Pedobacter sp. SJ11]
MKTHSSVTMSLLLKYSTVFNDGDQRTPAEILAPYGRTMTLKMIGVLNSMLQRKLKELPQQMFSWFGSDSDLGEQMMKKIFNGYRNEIRAGARLFLVNDHANLRMNVMAKNLPEIDLETAIDVDQSHLNFFKAYLKINEDFLRKQENIGATIPEEFTGLEKATWMTTATLISYYDFAYIDEVLAAIQMIKAMYCFDFLQKYNPQLYQHYLDNKGVVDFKDYAKKMFPLTNLCFTDAVGINGSDQANQQFLEIFNHQVDIPENEENVAKRDFLAIRNRPLYKVGENDFVMLNRAMIINKMYTSIYWDCKAIIDTNPALGISQNGFRTDYTTEFSEGYLVYKLFEKAYGNKSYKQFSGEQMRVLMNHSEPDYYVRNGNKVFLIEVKDSFITGKAKQSFDVPTIVNDLKSKYYKTDYSEKAVKQLLTRIRLSLTMGYPFDQHYKPKSLKFYPILIVYDVNLTVPGIESVLIGWFETERDTLIQEMADKGITGFQINNVVVLHIDCLILLNEYIRAGRIKLEDLIDGHLLRRRNLLKITNAKSFKEIKASVLNSYLSFNEYVRNIIDQIPPGRRIMPSEYNIFKD